MTKLVSFIRNHSSNDKSLKTSNLMIISRFEILSFYYWYLIEICFSDLLILDILCFKNATFFLSGVHSFLLKSIIFYLIERIETSSSGISQIFVSHIYDFIQSDDEYDSLDSINSSILLWFSQILPG